MNLNTWIKGTAAAGFIFLIIFSFGYFSVSRLKEQARLIAEDTLPGLSEAGAANASLAASQNQTLLFLLDSRPEFRKRYRDNIQRNSENTTGYLERYRKAMEGEDDKSAFARLIKLRQDYLDLRSRLLDLVDYGSDKEALALFNESVAPAYERYKQAGEEVLQFNIKKGKLRSESILRSSTRTQFFVATLGLVLFVVGFLFGLFR